MIGARRRILGALDVVQAVTIGAGRGDVVAALAGEPMDGRAVILDFLLVASRAGDRLGFFGVGQFLGGDVGVTVGALEMHFAVHRLGERRVFDDDRSAVGAFGVLVAVAGRRVSLTPGAAGLAPCAMPTAGDPRQRAPTSTPINRNRLDGDGRSSGSPLLTGRPETDRRRGQVHDLPEQRAIVLACGLTDQRIGVAKECCIDQRPNRWASGVLQRAAALPSPSRRMCSQWKSA